MRLCEHCGQPMTGSGSKHFDCAVEVVTEWAQKHDKCAHPKSCLFVKAKKKKTDHA